MPVVLIIAHPNGCEVAYPCGFDLPLMANNVEHLECASWPFVYYLWRNVYSSHLAILNLDYLSLIRYSSPPPHLPGKGDMFQYPQWMPEHLDSPEPYMYIPCFFLYTHTCHQV